MKESIVTQLNRLLWEEKFIPGENACVKVTEYGMPDRLSGNFKGAEVEVGGKVYRGTVFFTDSGAPAVYSNEAILQVCSAPSPPVRLERGEPVHQLVVNPPQELQDYYDMIFLGRESRKPNLCSGYISSLDDVKRVQLFLRLFTDRCERKFVQDIGTLLRESNNDWNYAMYVTLFRAMGGSKYKDTYVKLAGKVPYPAIAHEKGNPRMVEALLLGASGLLQRQTDDDYIVGLKKDFDYLCRKYNIVPMHAAEWDDDKGSGNFPYGFPVLRIAQLAGFLSAKEFIFDSVIQCRKPGDIYRLFSAEVPDYWSEKFNSTRLGSSTRRMGVDHMDRMGINFVVPLMFAYASATGNDALTEAAQNLIDTIDGESNRIIRLWRERGVKIANACDSQAILELNNEYCLRERCHSCPVGKKLIKKQLSHGYISKNN